MSTSNIFSNVYIYGNCTVAGTLSALGGSITSQWTTSGSAIYYTTGNVGIGTNNPTGSGSPGNLLHVYDTSSNNPTVHVDSSGGTGQARLHLRAGAGTTNRASRIDFFNNVTSSTVPQWTIISGYDQNGTNDLRFVNYAGTIMMSWAQNGNIGIGTTNPGSLLTVSGGASLGSAYTAYSAPTGGLIVQGNVGIGTSNPGVNALQVSGNVVTSGFTSNSTNTIFNFDTMTVPFISSTQVLASTSVGIGTTVIQPVPTGAGSNYPLFFTYGTNTSARGALIQTVGTSGTSNISINTDGNNPNIELRSSTNSGAPYIDFASSSSGVDYDARMILVNNGNTFSLSSNIIQLNPTTGVGIGTNSPGSTLQVSGTGATFTCGGVVGTSNVLQFGSPTTYYGTSSAYLSTRFAILTSGLPVTNDAFNGNGGVYASAQGIRIQGQDLTWASGAIRSYGSSIEVDGGGSKNASISYGQIRFYTANNQRLTIDESGNVGIGNTTPYLPLLVNSTGNGGIGQGGIGLTVKQGDVDLTIGNVGGGFTIPYIQSFNNGSTTALGTSQYSITLNPFRGSVGIGTWSPRQTIDLPQTNFYPSSQNSLISRINWSYCYPNNTNITYSPTFNPSSTARIYFPNPATTASSSATGIYLNLGTITPTPASSGFTVIARVMFTTAATNSWERIFDWGNGQSNDNILLARYSTTTQFSFGMQNGGTGMPNLNGGTIVQNVVTNVAIKFDPSASGGTAYLYQDGVLLASQTASASTYTNNNARTNCYIGRSNWGTDSLFTGYIYEFQAHNAVLTDAEIFAVMNSWNGTAAVSITTGGDVNCTGSYRIGNVLQPKIPSSLQGSWSAVSSVTINGFDLATSFYSAEIRLNWYKNGSAGNNGNVSFNFKDTGGNSLSVQEANTTEYRNGGATNNTGAVAYLASGAEPVGSEYGSVIRVWSVRPGSTGGRYHYTFESVGCYAGIGATTNRGQGFVTVSTGTVSQIVISCSSGTFGGVYSVVQYI